MNDEPEGPLADEEPGLGEPVRALADLREPVSAGFVDRVRGKIERRDASASLLGLAWHVPALVVLEFLDMIFRFVGFGTDREGDAK